MHELIKKFVIESLGCNCPEEVFERIEVEHQVELADRVILKSRINIGNRLMIYVLQLDDIAILENTLSKIISRAVIERNRRGFNRVRIIILTEKPRALEEPARMIFRTLAGKDDRVHLHVVEKSAYLT
jgi:hypothetical protein